LIEEERELLDVIWELSDDENYKFLYDKIRKKKLKRRKWNMCEIARELEKIVRYFSISMERAQRYYERAITQ